MKLQIISLKITNYHVMASYNSIIYRQVHIQQRHGKIYRGWDMVGNRRLDGLYRWMCRSSRWSRVVGRVVPVVLLLRRRVLPLPLLLLLRKRVMCLYTQWLQYNLFVYLILSRSIVAYVMYYCNTL